MSSLNRHAFKHSFCVVLAFLACIFIAVVETLETNVSACALCKTLDRYISDVGVKNVETGCHVTECLARGKVQLFVNEMGLVASSCEKSKHGVSLTIDDKQLAQLLVYAIIGRHFTNEESHEDSLNWNVAQLQYNVNTQKISVSRPMCVFEKGVYSILLVLSVIIVLTSIVLRRLKKYEEIASHDPAPPISLEINPPISHLIKRRTLNLGSY